MLFYVTGSTDPFYNLAAEEWLLRNSDDDIVMLWQNRPSIIIGKNQNLYAEVREEEAQKRGVPIVRRITGGGAVYHDFGNVNYSFLTSRDRAKVLDFAYFTAPIVKALAGLGIRAELSGRNDLLAEGLKFSGNAEAASGDRILHHGTLLFDSDLSVMPALLKPAPEKLQRKGIQSVRSRVTNLKPLLREPMETQDFILYLEQFFSEEFHTSPQPVPKEKIEQSGLAVRNASEDYIYGRKENLPYHARLAFPGGTVVLRLALADGRISAAAVEGDFFGEKDAAQLAEGLIGQRPLSEELLTEMTQKGLSADQYIQGMTNESWARLVEETAQGSEKEDLG